MTFMTRLSCLALSLLSLGATLGMQQQARMRAAPGVRFEAVDVFVDSGDQPLAAYQFELKAPARDGYEAIIVGVEGGEHAAYVKAPYYDTTALQHDRIIIASYSLNPQLPKGKTRVARLHMELRPVGPAAAKDAEEQVAARSAGRPAAPTTPAAPGRGVPKEVQEERNPLANLTPIASRIEYSVELITAASPDGAATPATVSVAPGANP